VPYVRLAAPPCPVHRVLLIQQCAAAHTCQRVADAPARCSSVPIPKFQHPSHSLLEENNFTQMK
jgi:hypothetical protein